MGGPEGPPREPEDDRDLVERARRGDREAFATLVRRHQDRAFNLAFQVVRNREDALDISQEAFARAYTSLPAFKGEASFTTWLHRIVVNQAIDNLRRTRRSGTTAYDDTRAAPEGGDAEPAALEDPVGDGFPPGPGDLRGKRAGRRGQPAGRPGRGSPADVPLFDVPASGCPPGVGGAEPGLAGGPAG